MPEIDIVFMDIKLPDISGYDVTGRINQIRKNLPVIAQTAFAMPQDEKKAIQSGCDGYVSKPYTKKTIYEIITKNLFSDEIASTSMDV